MLKADVSSNIHVLHLPDAGYEPGLQREGMVFLSGSDLLLLLGFIRQKEEFGSFALPSLQFVYESFYSGKIYHEAQMNLPASRI